MPPNPTITASLRLLLGSPFVSSAAAVVYFHRLSPFVSPLLVVSGAGFDFVYSGLLPEFLLRQDYATLMLPVEQPFALLVQLGFIEVNVGIEGGVKLPFSSIPILISVRRPYL